MDSDEGRRSRADARRKTAILRRTTLQRDETDLVTDQRGGGVDPRHADDQRGLVPERPRPANVHSRFDPLPLRAGSLDVIELSEDFRDLLVELADAGSEFVVLGGHAGNAFDIDGRRIPVIGLHALPANKHAAGREQDVADVRALERQGRRTP